MTSKLSFGKKIRMTFGGESFQFPFSVNKLFLKEPKRSICFLSLNVIFMTQFMLFPRSRKRAFFIMTFVFDQK